MKATGSMLTNCCVYGDFYVELDGEKFRKFSFDSPLFYRIILFDRSAFVYIIVLRMWQLKRSDCNVISTYVINLNGQ